MDEALDEGRRALDEYDFETARAAFERAHLAQPLEARAVCALLDLFVQRLGLDADAIELADSLNPGLLESQEVAAPLALAAARTGDRERAERWSRTLDGPHAAEVHRTLAAAAIDAGDIAYAATALGRARQAFAADSELITIEKRLAETQALAVKARESQLAELAAHADLALAVAVAHEILAEHPGSVPARKVLKEAALRAREAERTAALTEIQAALAARDTKRARLALARARSLDANQATTKESEEAMERIESAAKEAAEQSEIDAISARLARIASSAEWEAVLASYASLDARPRAEVRRKNGCRELVWFDELEASREASRLAKVTSAVMAMAASDAALSAGHPEGALVALAPHRQVLRDSKAGRDLVARAEVAAAEERRSHARSLLTQAEAALAAGDLTRTQSLIEAVRRSELPESLGGRFEELKNVVAARRQRQSEVESLERHLGEGDLIRARQLLFHLLHASGTREEVEAWNAHLSDIEARLRDEWIILDHRPMAGLDVRDAPEMSWVDVDRDGVAVALLPGGQSAVFMSTSDRLVFIRVVDVESREIRRLVVLRAPEALGYPAHGLAGDRLWILGEGFQLLEISCDDWLPRRWCSLKSHVNAGQRFESGFALPQANAIWLRSSDPSPGWVLHSHVIDTEDNRLLRTTSKDLSVRPILGTSPPLVIRTAYQEGAHIAGARGVPLIDLSLPRSYQVLGVSSCPSGSGFLVLAFSENEPEETIEVFATDTNGKVRSHVSLPGIGERPSTIATVHASGVTYVSYHEREAGELRLARLGDQAGNLVLSDETSPDGECILLQDEAATTALALRMTARGVDLSPIGEVPPHFAGPAVEYIEIPSFEWPLSCTPVPDLSLADSLRRDFAQAFYGLPEEQRPAWVERRGEALVDMPAGLLCLRDFLHGSGVEGAAEEILQVAERLHPNDLYVRLAVVEREARAGRWTGDNLLEEATDAAFREHLIHVHGLALFRADKPEEAIKAWSSAPTENHCGIEPLVNLVKAVVVAQSDLHSEADETADLPGLIRATLRSDECMVRGDLDGARRVLDRAWIRGVRETQTLARLAELHLATPIEADPLTYFRAASLLAEFAEVGEHDFRLARRLWLGARTWDQERIKLLVTGARAWLEKARPSKA
jgi:hypothetical protein